MKDEEGHDVYTFQEIIIKLQQYWAAQGCVVLEPYDSEVGAGTFHTATTLRSLGPDPWATAYVQPCRRPTDGRYGENPNRLQHYYQFQVLIKPSPDNIQQLYLDSLSEIGIDYHKHDLRFVEDDWESPTLGAWGLGWEVWLDGMEVTQFTYFQQVGGFECSPTPVEITYGLERLAMYIQGKDSVFDIIWSKPSEGRPFTYGDVFKENEREFSTYNFEIADTRLYFDNFDHYESECHRILEQGLPLPAYDCVLKCSHFFNILDARKAISQTERMGYILRVRSLAKACCQSYLDNVAAGPHLANDQASSQTSSADVSNAGAEPATPTRWPNQASDYILEIGVEEVPSKALYKATQQLAELATKALDGARIEHGEIHTQSTPRRLVLRVDKLATRTKPLVQKFRGPAAKIAYDEVGNLTDAGIGFAHKKGVAPEKLTCAEEHGTSYVFAEVEQYSKPTPEVLPALLETAIKSLDWPKSMHWGSGKATFIRPIRWILSLWGDQVIPLQYAGIAAGRATWGHHLLANQPFEVADTDQYSSVLGQAWVEGSARFRRQKIEAQIGLLEEKTNLVAHLEDGTDTLAEIVNLVESPTTLVGTFDQRYLQIPPEIIVDAITKHQRYLPLYSPDGKLSNRFLIVSNGTPAYASEITAGHERVVRPRLDDAEFFFQEDKQKPLVDYVDQLKEVVFHEKLGSLYDKTKRMVALAGFLADHEIDGCKRAALLAKADLVTSAVVEFTSLQGVLGYYYALASDEPEAVAVAIKEHYQPRFSGDCIPDSYEGKIVALADKLDSLAGLFAVGEAPTGSKDPFALRRSAIGVLNILRTLPQIDLGHALEAALSAFDARLDFDHSATAAALSTFLLGRLQVIAKEEGYRPDTIQAVLATGVLDPKTVLDRIATLDAARKNAPDVFDDLAVAYARANNLRDSALGQELDCALFTQPEQALYDATEAAESQVAEDLGSNDYKAALNTLAALRDPIDKLFEMVMIMDKDDKLKSNHLRLLNRFVGVFADVADFGLMAKK